VKPISLLPPELKEKRKNKRKLLLVGLVLAVCLVFTAGFNLALSISVFNVRNQTAQVSDTRAEVEDRIEELAPYQELYEALLRAEDIVESAVGDKPDWQGMLTEVGNSMPANSWLVDVQAVHEDPEDDEGDDQLGELLIRGYTRDHHEFSDWMVALEEIPLLTDVEYSFFVKTTYDGRDAYEFEVTAQVIPETFPAPLFGSGGEIR